MRGIGMVFAFALALSGCRDREPVARAVAQGSPHAPALPPRADWPDAGVAIDGTDPAAADRPVAGRITLAAVGDVLPHLMVKGAARARARRGPGGEDLNHAGFDAIVAGLEQTIEPFDLATFNMEAPVVPDRMLPHSRLRFFAPPGLPAALAGVGFDVAMCANNHAYDQGEEGLLISLGNLRAAGLDAVGCGPDLGAAGAPVVLERGGVRVAILSFAAIMNAYNPARRTHPAWPQVLFWYRDEPAGREVLEAVRAARARSDVDVVVVNAHWDREYDPQPLPFTRGIARQLVEAGADLVIGHHPHVLQPGEWMPGRAGRRAAVVYSLGNFISEMCASRAPFDLCDRRLSAIAVATLDAREGLVDLRFEAAFMDHRAACPGEASAPSGCVRVVATARERDRLAAERDAAPDQATRESLDREVQGYALRDEVIRRFMGPHPEGTSPASPYVGVDPAIVARSRHGRPRTRLPP